MAQALLQGIRSYAVMILKYGDADAARPVPIREKPFVAFHSPDNGPLGDLSAAGTDAGGVRTIDGMLTTLSIERVPQTAPDRRVSRFRGTNYCIGLAPPRTVVGDWVVRF